VLDPFPLEVENSAMKPVVKHHAERKHAHNQSVADAAAIKSL
jgi:hypothetical protein